MCNVLGRSWDFISDHKYLIVYLIAINVVSLIAFGVDKIRAMKNKWRIREKTLFGLSFLGGSIGALVGMYAFHHKTKKDYFRIGVPLILIMQIALSLFIINCFDDIILLWQK